MNQTNQNCQLLSAKALAKMLSLSARTVWRLRSAGKLPKPVFVGSSIRWKLSDIVLFIECDCDIVKYHVRKESEECQ